VASRFAAQRLHRPPDLNGVTGVVQHLLAVQAQDPAAFPLALRARLPGVTAADLAKARADRELVRCWGPRGTLHLIAAADLPWLYPLVKPAPAGSMRRLRELGTPADADTVVETVDAVLLGRGPLTKAELGDRLRAKGLAVTGQAIVHAAMLAAGRGLVVLGPERGGKPTYVHATDWLGAPLAVSIADRGAALRALIARYRAAHDPCEPADLAAWSALPLGEIASAWQVPAPSAAPASAPRALPVRLIPAYDEYLLGWRSRDHAVPAEFRAQIHPGGGIVRPAVLVDGRAAGTWQLRRAPSRADLTVTPFAPLPPATRKALDAEAADIAAFLDTPTRLALT
jgi:hypothetical protein